jgi:low affinity Fe/Cu permease
VHVDGAFGLWARASPKHASFAAGVEGADSWATDAHKWLNVPYDCGVAFVRDAAAKPSDQRQLLGHDRRRHGNQLSLHCCGSAKKEVMKKRSWFTRFAKTTAHVTGRPRVFALAAGTVAAWLISGPIFGFSDTWQLYINTGTTIVTFLMVFLIQNTQNRDTAAIQIKLDELIRVTKGHNALMDLEELEEQDLEAFRARYEKMAAVARRKISRGGVDIDSPEP